MEKRIGSVLSTRPWPHFVPSNWVEITLGKDAVDHMIKAEDRGRVAMARQ
jgi:hypothetical protein